MSAPSLAALGVGAWPDPLGEARRQLAAASERLGLDQGTFEMLANARRAQCRTRQGTLRRRKCHR